LRAAFDWSHDLLSADERVVFRRLGVFVGSFSLELAQRVAADDSRDAWAVLTHLGSLVNRSLVVVLSGAPTRYRLLETARLYALDQLERAGELDTVRERQAGAIAALLQAIDAAMATEPRIDVLVQRLEPEIDNLRVALRWAETAPGSRALAVAMAGASDWVWSEIDPYGEGLDHCRTLAPLVEDAMPAPLATRFWLAFAHLGRMRLLALQEWTAAARRALAGYRALGDRVGIYRALTLLGGANRAAIDEAEAGAMLEEAAQLEQASWSPYLRARRQLALEWWHDLGGRLEASRAAGREHLALQSRAGSALEVGALSNLADTEFELGNTRTAIELCRQAIERALAMGRPSAAAHAYSNMVPALLESGALAEAAKAIEAGRALLLRVWGSAFPLLMFLPLYVLERGETKLAAQLLGSAERAYSADRRDLHPPERRARERVLARLRGELTEAEIEHLGRDGASWSEDEAFENAGIG
jgi:hypothetical protein